MDTIEQALYAQLGSAPRLSVLVGGSGVSPATEARIYAIKLPEKPTLPAITYSVVSGTSEFTLDAKPVGLGQARIQISVWAKSSKAANAVREAVRKLVLGFKGTWGDVPVSVVEFNKGPDLYEEDTKIYQIPCHVLVWHGENVS